MNGEEIVTTVDHPFYVKNQGFIKAGELIVGDELLDVNGNVLLVENFDVELTDKPVKVYNFQVEDFHTYFVGQNNIWVHNAECGGSYKEVSEKNKEYNSTQSDYTKKQHAHHMLAHDAYPDDIKEKIGTVGSGKNKKVNGPSISMKNSDHTQTASYDNKPGAKAYRAKQKKLIGNGKLQEAFDMDVADIKSQFPGKYDSSIQQAQDTLNDIIKKVGK